MFRKSFVSVGVMAFLLVAAPTTHQTEAVVCAALGLAAAACRSVTDPRRAVVSYAISAFACDTLIGCDEPDSIHISSADRGDTVWIFSSVEGGNPIVGDSALVTARGECAENLVLLSGSTTVRTFPGAVTCPDSSYLIFVYRPPQPTLDRYFRWVVEPGVPVGTYRIEGRMLVAPDLRPSFTFEIR